MALTRAQLLQGNGGQGTVLSGQVQGVTAGSGVQISGAGVLSINSSDPTFNGFIKTNNGSAYNAYTWPSTLGAVGQQLTIINSSGQIDWADADGIPWTLKGQLVAATGAGTANQAFVNVGTNTSFLIANSSTATGLAYTDAVLSAALLPAGTSNDRPVGPLQGQIRFNTQNDEFEGYGSSTYTAPGVPAWQYLSSMPTGPVAAATGATNKIFYQNVATVTENYTTPTTANSMSAGPITIAAGKTVTVAAGSTWVIV